MFRIFKTIAVAFRRDEAGKETSRMSCITRRTFIPALLVAVALACVGKEAVAQGANDIKYYGTQPGGKPAFGQTVLLSGQIFRTDRGPLANQTVELWFSGRHGARVGSVFVRTDSIGRFNATMTIPRSWINGIRGNPTWVDVNINCTSIGVLKLFRVRDK